MFEYLFPIFAFGLVVTAIVCKGLYEALEEAKTDVAVKARSEKVARPDGGADLFASRVSIPQPERA